VLAGAAVVAAGMLALDCIGALSAGETSDRAGYALTIGVLAPLGGALAFRITRSLPFHPDEARGSAAVAAVMVLAAVGARRLAYHLEAPALASVLVTVSALGAALTAWRLAVARAGLLFRLRRLLWRPGAAVVGQLALAVLFLGPILPAEAWLRAGLFAVAIGALVAYRPAVFDHLPRGLPDAVAVGLVVVALSDASPLTDPASFRIFGQFHHDFFLAPVNDIQNGRAVLVDTIPQYGPGLHAFLAGALDLLPLTYGSFGLVVMVLTAIQYALLYALLRVAGVGTALALATVLRIVAACLYSSFAPPSLLPSTVGARHLPGYAAALASVLAASGRPASARWRWAALAGLAVAAAWSVEALAFSLAAWLGASFIRCAREACSRRMLARATAAEAAAGVLAVAAGVVGLSAAVLLWTGEAPAWGAYVSYVSAYNELADFTSASRPWAPLLLVGGVYVLSTVGLGASLASTLGTSHRGATIPAIGALTALGAVTLSYAVSRSDDFALLSVSTPAAALFAVWASALLPSGPGRISPAVLIAAALVPALLLGAGWSGARREAPHTLAGVALSDGPGKLADTLARASDFPPVLPAAGDAERIIRRAGAPGVAVLLEQDLQVEALLRAREANALPIAHPFSDSLLEDRARERLAAGVARLPACTVLLTQADLGAKARAASGSGGVTLEATRLIAKRFELGRIRTTRSGLIVARLVPKADAHRHSCPPVPRL
jgi:hypothetical protein